MSIQKLCVYVNNGILSGDFYKFYGDLDNPASFPAEVQEHISKGCEIILYEQLDEKSTHVMNHIHNDYLTLEQQSSFDD